MTQEENDTIRIEYDDNILDIIDKIDWVLQFYGLTIQDDEKEHDGFCIFNIGEYQGENNG
jgi:hypothetical protein